MPMQNKGLDITSVYWVKIVNAYFEDVVKGGVEVITCSCGSHLVDMKTIGIRHKVFRLIRCFECGNKVIQKGKKW